MATLLGVVFGLTLTAGCAHSSHPQAAAAPPPPPIEFIGDWGERGMAPGQLNMPLGMAVDVDNRVYLADPGEDFLQKFNDQGVPLLTFEDHALHGAAGIAVDSGGGIYVADLRAGQMHVFFPEGDPLHVFPIAPQRESLGPFIFSVDANGTTFVPDPAGGRIQVFSMRGQLERAWHVPADPGGKPPRPMAAVAGPDGFIYVGDASTGRILKFSRDGARAAGWSDAGDASPILGLAVSPKNMFVLRGTSPRLEVWTLDGQRQLTDDLGGRLDAAPASQDGASLVFVPDDELLVLDAATPRVLRFRTHLEGHP